MTKRAKNQPEPISVSRLNALIQSALRRALPTVWVQGEISDLSRPHSGHLYFTLKDQSSQIRAVMWRSDAERLRQPLQDGLSVVCHGDVDVYSPRGVYQLIVRNLESVGQGDLQLRLKQLHQKLSAEGLFDADRKRPLPRFPRHVAVVTSPTGAAVHDFLQVIRRRWAGMRISIVPTRVQGKGVGAEIAAAIRAANRMRPAPDVLAVIRGGGSLEDLWCFNEESVVRAVVASAAPVISGVGHEIDVTLSDLAADVRALTPTEAAERIAPEFDEVIAWLEERETRLATALRQRAASAKSRLDAFARRPAFARPLDRIRDLERRLDELADRAERAVANRRESQASRVSAAAASLEALSPLAVLARGYSVVRDQNQSVITNAASLQVGEQIATQFAQGVAISRVESLQDGSPENTLLPRSQGGQEKS